MNITRTITMIRTGNVKRTIHDVTVLPIIRWRNRKLAQLMTWVLSHHEVQQAVANTFDGATPMCRVLSNAVESGLDRAEHEVERMIESALDQFEVDACNVKGLEAEIEQVVESHFEDERNQRGIIDNVAEVLAERLTGGR